MIFDFKNFLLCKVLVCINSHSFPEVTTARRKWNLQAWILSPEEKKLEKSTKMQILGTFSVDDKNEILRFDIVKCSS